MTLNCKTSLENVDKCGVTHRIVHIFLKRTSAENVTLSEAYFDIK